MNEQLIGQHSQNTQIRAPRYEALFSSKPIAFFPYHQFCDPQTASVLIDVALFQVPGGGSDGRNVFIMITNGMSDEPLLDQRIPGLRVRTELVQYFWVCNEGHARRLFDTACVPHFDRFILQVGDTIDRPSPSSAGSPWPASSFLTPMPTPHQEFSCDIAGEPMNLLWYLPISKDELAFKNTHGLDAILQRMDETKFDWILDESLRTSLIPAGWSAPPASVPQFNAPQASAPPFGAPQASAPPFGAPPASAPQFSAPQASAPPFGAPPASAPPFGAPPVNSPPIGAPPVSSPQASAGKWEGLDDIVPGRSAQLDEQPDSEEEADNARGSRPRRPRVSRSGRAGASANNESQSGSSNILDRFGRFKIPLIIGGAVAACLMIAVVAVVVPKMMHPESQHAETRSDDTASSEKKNVDETETTDENDAQEGDEDQEGKTQRKLDSVKKHSGDAEDDWGDEKPVKKDSDGAKNHSDDEQDDSDGAKHSDEEQDDSDGYKKIVVEVDPPSKKKSDAPKELSPKDAAERFFAKSARAIKNQLDLSEKEPFDDDDQPRRVTTLVTVDNHGNVLKIENRRMTHGLESTRLASALRDAILAASPLPNAPENVFKVRLIGDKVEVALRKSAKEEADAKKHSDTKKHSDAKKH